MAQNIANVEGADLFEMEPKEKYTQEDLDYNDESRVCREYKDESLQDVELVNAKVKNWK